MSKLIKKLDRYLDHHLILLVLLTVTLILRLPSLFEPFWYGDENIYLAIGQAIRHGSTLYASITDFPNKPPLIYYLAAFAQDVFRFRLLLLFWTLASTFVFALIIKRFTRSRSITFISTLVFILFTSTPIIEGNIANAENFFILPSLLAVYFLTAKPSTKTSPTSTRLPYHFLAGLSLGLGFLFKIHVILDIAAIGLFFYLLTQPLSLKTITKAIFNPAPWVFLSGLIVPVILAVSYFASLGVSPQDLFLNAAGSTGYVSVWQGTGDLAKLTIGFGSLQARVVLLFLLTLALIWYKRRLTPEFFFACLWTLFALFAALLSARPYPHYLIQIAPPLSLVLALALYKKTTHHLSVTLALIALVALAFFRFDFSFYPVFSYYQNFITYYSGQIDRDQYYRHFDSRMPRNYQLALFVRQITTPQDKIYVWGTEPEIYVLADRLPIGQLVTSFHVQDLNYYDQTIAAINQQQPSVIVFMESEPRPFPRLEILLATDYALVDKIGDPGLTPGGNQGRYAVVYKRL